MKNNQLNLKGRDCLHLINSWIQNVKKQENGLDIRLSADYISGAGRTLIDTSSSVYQILIGYDVSNQFPVNLLPMNDMDFIKIGVTLFHEIDHYQQHIKGDVKECLLSELSKYRNDSYYKESWHELPHEIHAEYSGVMTMWEVMKQEFIREKVDNCMLDYINMKAEQTRYIIPSILEGYKSKVEVEQAFERAYEKSLNEKRVFQPNFLRYEDEVSRLVADNGVLRAEYYKHYQTLISNIPGERKDKLMSSMVIHLHPELQSEYPSLNFHQLSMADVFHLSTPESSLESRQRVLENQFTNEFAEAVKSLSNIKISSGQLL